MTEAEELRALREALGMSKRALARRWGVTRQAVQNFESGRAPTPPARLDDLRSLVRGGSA